MLGVSISKNSLILAIFAVITAGLLSLIYSETSPKIAEQQKKAAEKALLEIVPRERHNNSMLDSTWPIPNSALTQLGLSKDSNAHLAFNDDKLVAVILPATAPDGYSGDIHLLIGINANGSVAGVRVLSHKETPGLGDKIDLNKSDWLLSFDGHSLIQPAIEKWAVKKDGGEFDQFTGATITPRAVVNKVKETLQFFDAHKAILFTHQTEQNH